MSSIAWTVDLRGDPGSPDAAPICGECPIQWRDFHQPLTSEIRSRLPAELPEPYDATPQMRVEVCLSLDGEHPKSIVSDVATMRRLGNPDSPSGTAVVDHPCAEVSFSRNVELPREQIRHYFVEIRDSRQVHRLVTLIEILSPSNKRPGPVRVAYFGMQYAILGERFPWD